VDAARRSSADRPANLADVVLELEGLVARSANTEEVDEAVAARALELAEGFINQTVESEMVEREVVDGDADESDPTAQQAG
jgi:hypothetical protein